MAWEEFYSPMLEDAIDRDFEDLIEEARLLPDLMALGSNRTVAHRILMRENSMPPRPTARAVRVKATNAPAPPMEGFNYPTIDNKNVPPTSFDEYARCIFGPKGHGKSTLASQFPDHFTLMIEPMRRNLNIWMMNILVRSAQDIMNGSDDPWALLKLTIPRFVDDETMKGLNFDSIDLWYEACYHSVCASHSVTSPKGAGKGSADVWIEIGSEFANTMNMLINSRLSINFLSHMKVRESEELDGGKFDMKEPSCSPSCLKYIKQACDFVLYYGKYRGKRAIQIRDSTGMAFVACGPGEHFLQPDGKPIEYLEMPDLRDSKTGYQVLKEAFDNKHWDFETPEEERTIAKPEPKPLPRRPGPRK